MKEIERKFLIKTNYDITPLLYTSKTNISDIYLNSRVRIRNTDQEDKWMVTIKSKGDIERDEFEMPLLVKPIFDNIPELKKVRLVIPYMKQNFEVNIFENILYKGSPLILIELELKNKEQNIILPEWIGEEVTFDERFYGYQLANFLKFSDFCVVK